MKKSFIALMLVFLIPQCLIAQKTATLIYIDEYKNIAIKEMKRTGIPASITLAQGIIESNSGQSTLSLNFKNHFGIKCKSDWQGETTYQDDDTKQECFRVYPTAARSFIDHSDFLKSRPNYAPLFELDPVDDSAWAYGLKKAGYATAPDYARKLMKVITDFELSQFNFPELAAEDSMEAIKTPVVEKNIDTIVPLIKDTSSMEIIPPTPIIAIKDSSIIIKKDTLIQWTDTVQLSTVKGIEVVSSPITSTPNAIQGITQVKPAIEIDSVRQVDTIKKAIPVLSPKYPELRFRINEVPVVWAKAGSAYLAIANSQHVPLYRLFEYNEIPAADLIENDQLVFLASKKKETPKKIHTLKANETLYGISQSEGIQLNYLKQYNPKATDDNLKEGDFLFLFRPFDAPKTNNALLEALQPVSNSASKCNPELKTKPAAKDKIDIIKKIKSLINKKN
ncbi:MAG: glucosaminidase domain-containing protein [Bacteroidetes bacterium]|nr:glucosaminidase domain-containing protein [Bacteroidota bacterium]